MQEAEALQNLKFYIAHNKICKARKVIIIGTKACYNCVFCRGYGVELDSEQRYVKYLICEKAYTATGVGDEADNQAYIKHTDRMKLKMTAQAVWELQNICGLKYGETYKQDDVIELLAKNCTKVSRDTLLQASDPQRCFEPDKATKTVKYMPNYPAGAMYVYRLMHHNANNIGGYVEQYIWVFEGGGFEQETVWATVGAFEKLPTETPKQYIARVSAASGAKIVTEYLELPKIETENEAVTGAAFF